MSIEHAGTVDVRPDGFEASESKTDYADLLIVDSDEITEQEAKEWHAAGLEFLHNLSKESFQLRFGSPKPHDLEGLVPLVDYFAFSKKNHHQMVLLTHEHTLIGAASIFDYKLRERFGAEEIIDADHVVELSVTIADSFQGQGLGAELLQIAALAAAEDGKTHVYTSFTPANCQALHIMDT